jgi:hypothetical protein
MVLAKNKRESKQKIVEFRIGQPSITHIINKGAIVTDRPLQAIFGRQKVSFQNESVLKVGLNWVFLGPTLLEKKLKKDSTSFQL